MLSRDPVAIVGMGCRFPGGANDVESFWQLLAEGRSAIVDVPGDRWAIDRFHHPNPAALGTTVTRRGGFVDQLAGFDAAFWGISPREAIRLDPQQRWLLEVAWEAIEDAGIAPGRLRGRRVGVFVGISGTDYGGLQLRDADEVEAYSNSGSTTSIAANRISYLLDLTGPSASVDTACSSSLVAMWMACESIWAGNCDAALVGGVNALIAPETSIGFSRAAMLSPSGECFAFDARANGYVRAEGAGMVYVKPLDAALAAGDRIYAVVRGVVVNQDGHTSSMTVPSVDQQAAMLRDAYARAAIDPSRVSYVEAHGTGTPVGDPIEATAIGRVIGSGAPGRRRACVIGSVKTNIGHLEAGSGMAGLIKAALVLDRRWIPANRNYERPNPEIPFDDLRLEVAATAQPLPVEGDGAPVAGINSFGFGGTNAHVVLQAAPSRETGRPAATRIDRPFVLPISARDATALRHYVVRYRDLLAASPERVADIAAAAGMRKEHHPHRLAFVGPTAADICRHADAWLSDGVSDGIVAGRASTPTGVVFAFTGQGAQWWGMARQLYAREPIVRAVIDEVDERLQALGGVSLLGELGRDEAHSRIDRTDIAQPAILALQAGLLALWRSWGVAPAAVIGHSAGEVAAAYAAGALSLEQAVHLVFHRGRLQHRGYGLGRMLAVAMSPADATRAIAPYGDRLEIAAVNSPRMVTLAGDADALEALATAVRPSGVFLRPLRSDYAFHSRQMAPIRDDVLASLATLRPQATTVPFVSTVTGGVVEGERLDAAYWWANIRQAVLFAPGIAALIDRGHDTFLELGPHPALATSIKECLSDAGRAGEVRYSLRREADDSQELAKNAAGLHVRGVPLDWRALNQSDGADVHLPGYPWTRESYWVESSASLTRRVTPAVHPLLGVRIEAAQPTWQTILDLNRLDYLNDHRLAGAVIVPAAAFVEIALAVGRQLFPRDRQTVDGLVISRALMVDPAGPPRMQVRGDPDERIVAIYSAPRDGGEWTLHATARLVTAASRPPAPVDVLELIAAFGRPDDHDAYVADARARGYQFGPHFQRVQRLWRGGEIALAEIDAPALLDTTGYIFHPAILDACFHAFLGLDAPSNDRDALLLPQSIASVQVFRDACRSRLWAHARLGAHNDVALEADIAIYDDAGQPVADVRGFQLERRDESRRSPAHDFYRFTWHSQPFARNSIGEPATRPYLLIADVHGLAAAVAGELDRTGHGAIIRRPGDVIDDADVAGILYCASVDRPAADAMGTDQLRAAQRDSVLGARRLIAALANASVPVWFVTRQARRVLEEDGVDGLASTPLIGLARVANNEQGCRFFQIDLDDCAAPEAAALLAAHLTGPVDGEFEEAYRNGVRYVPRLEAAPPREWPPRTFPARRGRTMRPYRLEIDRPGVLEHLALHETEPRPLAAGDVEIDVRAGGLNFRDVMKALGSYPGHPADQRWLGDDVSGVVRRVGADVTDWRPGDEVAGVAPYAFQSLATADARLLFRKPASWSFAEAATVPTAFLTAHYALVHLARLQPGERVLIHAGAGGVGQAAIQIARRLQLEIFATAGSPAKRQRLLDDGADHVMDSRTLDFADEIRSLTGGAGVDAVLNSLAGEFVTKSLSVLAPFGRFLEIGKADVYRRSRFELHALRRNIAFFVIDLAEHLTQKHPVVVRLLDELARSFDAGDYRPLPLTTFPVDRAPDAFRHLAQARHVGKVVLTFDRPDVPIACSSDDAHRFRGDVTYLVTGGAGGVGLEVARWIAGHGGRYFALVSRSGPRDESAAAAIDALRGAGHVVHDFRADVAVTADVDRVLATIDAHLPPLGGVFHAAMVLDDALLGELDDDRMWRAMAPKVLGGWNLHAATRDRVTVEHFVCFSSVSTVIAAPGQANYNAGNVFLEALADYRRGQGLPAQTVSWGAIADAGYVARHPQTAAALATVGISAVRIEEALQVLQAIVVVDLPHVVAARVAWPEVLNLSPLAATANAYAAVRHQSSAGDRSGPLEARLRSTPPGEWPRRVEELIAGHVAAVLGTARARLDRAAPLNSLGLDSLMTLELINRLDRDIGVRVPIGNVSAGASVAELAKVVLRTMAPGQTRSAGEEPAGLKTGRSVNHLVLLRAAETDGAGEPPLFGFHPVGGGVSVYAPLAAQIAPAIPVYGVESRLLLGDAWEYADVDEMVTAYTGAVRRAHAGPYRLFGFSLGGYVAARVAEALERDGRTVDVVGVIDWDARPNLAPDAQRQALTRLAVAAYRYLQQDAGVLQTRSEGSLEPEMARLVDRVFDEQSGGDVFFSWAVERGLLLSTDLEGFARSYLARLEQHCRLLTRPLRRPRLQAPLYVWRASRGFGSPLASWEHTGQAGRELVIDGDHNALIRPAALERIASLLNDVFDRQATGKTR